MLSSLESLAAEQFPGGTGTEEGELTGRIVDLLYSWV
jgi:hypothetical protein